MGLNIYNEEYYLDIINNESYFEFTDGKKIKFDYLGSIELIVGPMRSGKSEELIRKLTRQKHANYKVIALKPDKDDRNLSSSSEEELNDLSSSIESRSKGVFPAIKVSNILDKELLENCIDNYDVIGIDEAQFIDNLYIFCQLMANLGKIIFVSGLNSDFKQRSFNNIDLLIPLVENIIYLDAICASCPINKGRTAHFSIVADFDVFNSISDNILIGDNVYKTVCRSCLAKYKHKLSKHKSELN
jgi:thymidine kinase